MYSVTAPQACWDPGAIAHRLRTDALVSSRQCPHNAANPGTRDLPFRTIPAVADQFRQGPKGTANAVWVNSPSGVQIPEPPPLRAAFPGGLPPGSRCFRALRTLARTLRAHGCPRRRRNCSWSRSSGTQVATGYAFRLATTRRAGRVVTIAAAHAPYLKVSLGQAELHLSPRTDDHWCCGVPAMAGSSWGRLLPAGSNVAGCWRLAQKGLIHGGPGQIGRAPC